MSKRVALVVMEADLVEVTLAVSMGCIFQAGYTVLAWAATSVESARAALAAAGVVPRDLSAAGFDGWVGSAGSGSVKLRQLVALRRCVFGAAPADASRRDQLRAIAVRVEGADWEQRQTLRIRSVLIK